MLSNARCADGDAADVVDERNVDDDESHHELAVRAVVEGVVAGRDGRRQHDDAQPGAERQRLARRVALGLDRARRRRAADGVIIVEQQQRHHGDDAVGEKNRRRPRQRRR